MKVYKMKEFSRSEYNEGAIRSRLNNHETAPPSDMWNRIESRMDARKRRFGWLFFSIAALLLVSVGGWMALKPRQNVASLKHINSTKQLAINTPFKNEHIATKASENTVASQKSSMQHSSVDVSTQSVNRYSKAKTNASIKHNQTTKNSNQNNITLANNNSNSGNDNSINNLVANDNSLLSNKAEADVSKDEVAANNKVDANLSKDEASTIDKAEVKKEDKKKPEDIVKPGERKYHANRSAHPWAFGVSVKTGVSSHLNSGESSTSKGKDYYNNIETAKASSGLEAYLKYGYKNGLFFQGGLACNNVGFGGDTFTKASQASVDYIFVGILGTRVKHLHPFTGYNFNLISMPLKVGTDFSFNRFNVFVKGGLTPSLTMNVDTNFHETASNPSKERLTKINKFNTSIGGEAGLNFKVARNVNFGLGYSTDFYLNSITKTDIRTRFITNRLYTGLQFKL